MDKTFRSFQTHEEADRESHRDNAKLATAQRLANFLVLMKPVYDSAPRLQRVYRTGDFGEPEVRDRWRMGG